MKYFGRTRILEDFSPCGFVVSTFHVAYFYVLQIFRRERGSNEQKQQQQL